MRVVQASPQAQRAARHYSKIELLFVLKSAVKYGFPLSPSGVDILRWWSVLFWLASIAIRPAYQMYEDAA